MSDTAKRRLAIDLDEIERQLQQTAPQRAATGGGSGAHDQGGGHGGGQGGKGDPLAELARIVGQDDPFRSILSGERAGAEPHRADPDHDAVFGYGRDETQPPQSAPGSAQTPPAAGEQAFTDWLPQDAQPEYRPQEQHPVQPDSQHQGHHDAWPQPQGRAPEQLPGYDDHFAPQTPQAPQQPQDWREEDLYADPRHGAPMAPADGGRQDHRHGYAQGYQQDYSRPDLSAPPAYLAPQHAGPGAYQGQDAMAGEGDYPEYDDSLDDLDHAPRLRRERRGNGKAMMTVGIVLGVAVIGVASALYFVRSTGPAGNGEPPLISAETEPMRIEPVNPGGVDIPDQDRQIFERTTEDETRVVDREEQPVDVGEIARSSPRVVLPPPAATQNRDGATDPIAQVLSGTMEPQGGFESPPEVSAAVAELGEPRRVRTVTVRPDGTIIRNGSDAPREFASLETSSEFSALSDASVPSPATERMPWEPDPATEAASQPQSLSDQGTDTAQQDSDTATDPLEQILADNPPQGESEPPAASANQTAQSTPEPAREQAPAPRQPMALTGATQIAPQAQQQQQNSPQQTASVSPAQPAATGDYVVQLGISNSEDRARQAFSQFQSRYSGIIDDASPIVRRAEVNGNTIYRVRVGPYDLSSANSVCDRIKNAGGDCFVARN